MDYYFIENEDGLLKVNIGDLERELELIEALDLFYRWEQPLRYKSNKEIADNIFNKRQELLRRYKTITGERYLFKIYKEYNKR